MVKLRTLQTDSGSNKGELDGMLRLRHQDDHLAMGWGGFVGNYKNRNYGRVAFET